ncbi:MAG: VOC family protein [Verrucomicrobiota bacterium]
MNIIDLNHTAIFVADVEKSKTFYGEKLGLPEMDRPAFNFSGAWFRLGETQELHLIGGRKEAVVSDKRGTHFALQVPDLDAAWEELGSRGVRCFSRQTRPDGAFQFYVKDPDGYIIEFCQVKNL